MANGGVNVAALSLLQQQQAVLPQQGAHGALDPTAWALDPVAAAAAGGNLQLLYQNAAMGAAGPDWARAAAAAAAIAEPR
jgi:hypothetical protein